MDSNESFYFVCVYIYIIKNSLHIVNSNNVCSLSYIIKLLNSPHGNLQDTEQQMKYADMSNC